jgi:hypothetical protein
MGAGGCLLGVCVCEFKELIEGERSVDGVTGLRRALLRPFHTCLNWSWRLGRVRTD